MTIYIYIYREREREREKEGNESYATSTFNAATVQNWG